jgi:hypothetical protein
VSAREGHTPGPWEVSHSGKAGDTYCVAGPDDAEGFSEAVATVYTEADAYLIRAAPAMYAALQAAVACRMVPASSAADGGACALSEQVRVADMIRAALRLARGDTGVQR